VTSPSWSGAFWCLGAKTSGVRDLGTGRCAAARLLLSKRSIDVAGTFYLSMRWHVRERAVTLFGLCCRSPFCSFVNSTKNASWTTVTRIHSNPTSAGASRSRSSSGASGRPGSPLASSSSQLFTSAASQCLWQNCILATSGPR
jgi:hypothetical protein